MYVCKEVTGYICVNLMDIDIDIDNMYAHMHMPHGYVYKKINVDNKTRNEHMHII